MKHSHMGEIRSEITGSATGSRSDSNVPSNTNLPEPSAVRRKHKVLLGFIRWFAIIYGSRSLLKLIPLVLSGKRKSLIFALANKDTFKFALSWSTFISAYRVLQNSATFFVSHPYITTLISSPALLIDTNQKRRSNIGLLISIRTAYFAILRLLQHLDSDRNNVSKKVVATLIRSWGPISAFYICISHVSIALLVTPWILPGSYYRSIVTISGRKRTLGTYTQGIHDALNYFSLRFCEYDGVHPLTNIPPEYPSTKSFIADKIDNMMSGIPMMHVKRRRRRSFVNRKISGLFDENVVHEKLLCAFLHPTESICWKGALVQFKDGFLQALKIYFPLNLVFLFTRLIVDLRRRKNLQKKTKSSTNEATTQSRSRISFPQMLRTAIESTIKSSVFVGSLISVQMILLCTLRKTFKREHFLFYVASGLISTPLVFLERSQRLLELNLYCFMQVFESLWIVGRNKGWWKDIKNGDMIYLPFVLGLLVHLHQTAPGTVGGLYKLALNNMIGEPPKGL